MLKRIVFGLNHNKISSSDLLVRLKDIDHNRRLHNKFNLELESFDEVHIHYLLDQSKYIRHLIKDADLLLKIGGKFIIHTTNNNIHNSFLRSVAEIKSELSLCTKNRYHLLSKNISKRTCCLNYKKISSNIEFSDTINNWSFGIITNGKDLNLVERLVKSIQVQNIPNYEIIICGPTFNSTSERIINAGDYIAKDTRAPICAKKNKIISKAKFHNIAIFHARFELPKDWYMNMKKFGNEFEILIFPILTHENFQRINDWSVYKRKFIPIYLARYTSFEQDWYAQGGVIISKKRILNEVPLNENLHWDELEDVVFSNELKLKGYTVHVDIENHLLTSSNRIKSRNISTLITYNLYFTKVLCSRIYNYFKNIYFYILNRFLYRPQG